jgi:hypothetical protein
MDIDIPTVGQLTGMRHRNLFFVLLAFLFVTIPRADAFGVFVQPTVGWGFHTLTPSGGGSVSSSGFRFGGAAGFDIVSFLYVAGHYENFNIMPSLPGVPVAYTGYLLGAEAGVHLPFAPISLFGGYDFAGSIATGGAGVTGSGLRFGLFIRIKRFLVLRGAYQMPSFNAVGGPLRVSAFLAELGVHLGTGSSSRR